MTEYIIKTLVFLFLIKERLSINKIFQSKALVKPKRSLHTAAIIAMCNHNLSALCPRVCSVELRSGSGALRSVAEVDSLIFGKALWSVLVYKYRFSLIYY